MNDAVLWLTTGGSAIGAVLRYVLGQWMGKVNKTPFPWGTWIINMVGTLCLAIFTAHLAHEDPHLFIFLGAGFCGGFTTFSSFSTETVALWRTHRGLAIAYVASSVILGLAIAAVVNAWMPRSA